MSTPETQIANFTPDIIRGGIYVTVISFLDGGSLPVATLSASFIGTPEGGSPFTWDAGNGLFIPVSTGTYRFNLTEADTSALTWDAGTYRISIVDASGFTFPCFIDGLMFARDC